METERINMIEIIKKHPIRTFTLLQPVVFAVVHYLSQRGIIGHEEVVLVTTVFETIAASLVGRQVLKDRRA